MQQEKARVMSIDDVMKWAFGDTCKDIYIQEAATGIVHVVTDEERKNPMDIALKHVNGEIRCWTALPTLKQRNNPIPYY